MVEFVIGKIRVQFPVRDVVRIERMRKGKFCDANTFFVPDRSEFTGWKGAELSEEDGIARISFGEFVLVLPSGGKTLTGTRLERGGKPVWKYKKTPNSGELPAPGDTPEVFALSDTPRIVVPEGGYAYRDRRNSGYKIDDGAEDVYLLLCGKDCKKLRRLYIAITGKSELVRLATLGLWDSRYFAYDQAGAQQRILDYGAHDLPLDNMVIDTDWRAASDVGIGYDVNTKLFPDLQAFFDFAHEHGVEVMFNDHPEPVKGAPDLFDPAEVRYREEKLQGLLAMGLDTWWYDRNWHTKLKSPAAAVLPETFGMYLFAEITKHFYQKKARDKQVYRRPVIMANVNNVENGKYEGKGKYRICDSASHRYSIQWTGDIPSDFASLGQEVETLVSVGADCIPYVNADCGGHTGNPDKQEYIRWMQFGALSPVLRPHCTKGLERSREPWAYDDETLDIVRRYIRLRYRLLPFIYSLAHESYEKGIPMFRALGFEYPEDRRACREKSEYLLGKDLLVAPIARYGQKWVGLPKSYYAAPVKATFFAGRECKGKPLCTAEYDELAIYLDGTAPQPEVPVFDFSARFETTLVFPRETELTILSDDGATVYIDGKKVHEDKNTHAAQCAYLGVFSADVPHKVQIEYFQAEGEACIALGYTQTDRPFMPELRDVYLPRGKWINLFTGKSYGGGRTHSVPCPISELPLFVRAGALIPLARDASNTAQQSWQTLAFDFYPDEDASCEGMLTEDDGETTAYLWGEMRRTAYSARYDRVRSCYVIGFGKAEGSFEGERCVAQRTVLLRAHLSARRIIRVLVNGKESAYNVKKRDGTAFPLAFEGGVPDSEVVEIALTFAAEDGAEVRLFCR